MTHRPVSKPPSTAPGPDTDSGPRARCSCGHDHEHFMVSAENDYTFWGWVLVWTGVSAIPRRVRFRCRDCQEVFAETDDPALCQRYR